jgi:putative photosynthetic complex assembly protein 2
MPESMTAALIAIFLWWLTTGAILFAVTTLARQRLVLAAAAGCLLFGGLITLHLTEEDVSANGAYLSFLAALGIWGAVEISFLGGLITGPNRKALRSELTGLPRFWSATRVVLWHEIFILALGFLLIVAFAQGPNCIGLITYGILWVMRLSAKLNLYLGVRNTGETMLPAHLRYMSSYFAHRPMNLLFPFSITQGTLLSAWLFHKAFADGADAHQAVGFMLIATIASLAVIEHWFLMLPLPIEKLWRWGLRNEHAPAQTAIWSTDRSGPFDTRPLNAVLARITAGAFGSVESLKGSIRSSEGWLALDFVDGIMHFRREAASETMRTGIVVTGRLLDMHAIQSEFENYALRHGA